MKKLYKVRIEDIVYVMAESEEEAVQVAISEGDSSSWRNGETVIATKDNFDQSTGWDMYCIPFGEEELTIDEILRES
jgi:hypothetical protein